MIIIKSLSGLGNKKEKKWPYGQSVAQRTQEKRINISEDKDYFVVQRTQEKYNPNQ